MPGTSPSRLHMRPRLRSPSWSKTVVTGCLPPAVPLPHPSGGPPSRQRCGRPHEPAKATASEDRSEGRQRTGASGSRAMSPRVGVTLSGRYRLQRLIATGGMGQVWEGIDSRLGRRVAVKVLKAEYSEDAEFVERFRAEARTVAMLNHPGIASVYDYGETDMDGERRVLAGSCWLRISFGQTAVHR